MKAHVFLIVTKSGVDRITKSAPTLGPNQRAVRLTIFVPDAAFLKPPVIDAELHIPAEAMAYPAMTEPVAVEIWPEP